MTREADVRIRVDRDRCCGSGNCVLTAPEVFDQDDADGLVLLRRTEPAPDVLDRVRRAVDLCPSGALRLDAPTPGHSSAVGYPSTAGSPVPDTSSTS
ncbi:ferredoxin [Micromonospora sp. NPDC048930]|uniref:ferredoxin n=1 Tax=Micromonospora sp. NPDC048930 TaxID=3364261 RepID=UPI003723FB5D